MKSSGIICSQNLAFSSFQSAGTNKWKFTGDDTHGIIVKMGDNLNISVGGDGVIGCHAEGLIGVFTPPTAVAAKAPPSPKMAALVRAVAAIKAQAVAAIKAQAVAAAPAQVVAAAKIAVAATAVASPGGFSVGQRVRANWKGSWYNAKILKVKGNKYYITYPGWDSSWNAWVSARKLKAKGSKAPAKASGSSMKRATVTVKVLKTKSDGRAWDAFGGKPDISLCISSDSGTKCYPDGDSVMGILEPKCRDAFRCTFTGVMVPSGDFEITVVDIDMAANDSIGSTYCSKGKSCSAGQAKVTIR